MNFLKGLRILAAVRVLIVVGLFTSCEQEITTIGDGVIGGEPFTTNKATYDVFAYNRKIEAVQTNKLPVYQLGVYTDPIYGKTEASITTQVQLTTINPSFGDISQQTEDDDNTQENEQVERVILYIPFLNNVIDTDNDGVPDGLDDAPEDPTNDSDGDTIGNNVETANNTDPLNMDTDGDGERDDVDSSTLGGRFAKRVLLDSIYYKNQRVQNKLNPEYLGASFNLKVERTNFYLRDLDPGANFEEAQEYFSNQQFSPDFSEETFFDGSVTISDREIVFFAEEDDPLTDENEIGTITSRLNPGIRVELNETAKLFFQANVLDKEGSSELRGAENFKTFFKSLHFSSSTTEDDLLLLLDLTNATIDIDYTFTNTDQEEEENTVQLRLITRTGTNPIIGNAVNTFVNEAYPAEILNEMDTDENASKIYLKGGAGSFAEIQLFDEDEATAETLINEIKANNWIINEANLIFYIDSDAMTFSIEPLRLNLYNAETNSPLYNGNTENNFENTPLGIFLNYDGIIEKSADGRGQKYTVRITDYINNIIVRDSTNARLGLSITPDIRISGFNNAMLVNDIEDELPVSANLTSFGTVLFGSNLPITDDKRLKLEIFYTETN